MRLDFSGKKKFKYSAKPILELLFSILSVLSLLVLTACSSGSTKNEDDSRDLEFKVNGYSTCTVKGIGKYDGSVLNIPNEYYGRKVIGIEAEAFKNCEQITNVKIPSSVKSIGSGAFEGCKNLKSISIAGYENTIASDILRGCESLEYISVNHSYGRWVGNGNCLIDTQSGTLIAGCKNSEIPSDGSVTKIAEYAFYNIKTITSISIPASVTSIENHAFEGSAITEIKISDIEKWCCVEIGEGALPYHDLILNDAPVTNLDLSDKSITLKNALSCCTSLRSIILPADTTEIFAFAFRGCKNLTNAVIPENVKKIGSYAFSGCTSIRGTTLPEKLESIGDGAFSECLGFTNIFIPSSVKVIGKEAFSSCKNMTSITISNGVESIGENAFAYCDSLKSILIPSSVKSMELNVFSGCSDLTIYTEIKSSPEGWVSGWASNIKNGKIVWKDS